MKKLLLILLMLLFVNTYSQINTEGKTVEGHFSYGLNSVSYCNFYEYKIYKNTELKENPFLQELQNNYKDSVLFTSQDASGNYLKIKSVLKFLWNDENVICINFNTVNNHGEKESQIYTNISSLKIIQEIKEVLKLSNKSFWQFYNNENNSKYPEINKLKPLVKDANGILNIEKLGKVIKENKDSLSKYLDE
ncbi:hypothetical protein VOI54_14360 [Tamlana sp. 2201CG12-4]|uniref:hypothetical protein n=1 Tax=Tamlana sp. 2201CG12-4 TaxID=3112582 RepID=UPI002DBA9F0E|nr:hypothetical protein [Tamlana sp. 2201CG12-4]MEC3908210.1 hypothetical protein [Tamlana sp. 2201CG12-4]